MGTDIHARVDFRLGEGQPWQVFDEAIFPYKWYNPDAPDSAWNKPFNARPTDERNYGLFAMLANVRNGSGFAGCDLGDAVPYVHEPKGLPEETEDVVGLVPHKYDDETDEEQGQWMGDHTFSWLTLAELDEYTIRYKDYVTKERGVLSEEDYKKWDGKSEPGSYCGAVWCRWSVTLDFDIYDAWMDAPEKVAQLRKTLFEAVTSRCKEKGQEPPATEDQIIINVRAEWSKPLFGEGDAGHSYGGFEELCENLRKVAELKGVTSEDVRVVFGFDS